MNEDWKFSDIPYVRPDAAALQARYDELTRRAKNAASAEELLQVVRERDALRQEVGLCQSIATIRAFHDVTDEFYQKEYQETLPRLEMLDGQSLAAAIAESPYAAAVDEAFGPQLRRLLELDRRLYTGGKELQSRISQLSARDPRTQRAGARQRLWQLCRLRRLCPAAYRLRPGGAGRVLPSGAGAYCPDLPAHAGRAASAPRSGRAYAV